MPGQTKVCRMCGVELGPLPIPPVLVCSERCYFSYKLEGKYGITIDDYEHLLHAQNGVCAICGGVQRGVRPMGVDHNHTTGKVRGILCSECNTGLGKFGDDIELLQAALAYLKKGSVE